MNSLNPQDSHSRTNAFLQIHFAVILFGFTAILGRLITLPGPTVVFFRILLTLLSLAIATGVVKKIGSVSKRELWRLSGIGLLVSLHWITFFWAIKLSNVTITLTCLGTSSFTTALLEPMILRTRMKWYEAALGVLVFAGVYIIFRFNSDDTIGIIVALLSATFSALFGVLNKKMVERQDPLMITFVELGSGWILVAALMPVFYFWFPDEPFVPLPMDWVYLSILAFLCTSIAYVIALRALKVLTPFVVALSVNLEPVYGILMAFAIFSEHRDLDSWFFAGTGLILLSVLLHPLLEMKYGRKM